MNERITLLSHHGCPYVQRVAIVLAEKGVAHDRRDVDLNSKPEWFRAVSPLGLIPVLLVGSDAIFESTVICEYLDEIFEPRLHPSDPMKRAQHRAWMEFGSGLLQSVGGFSKARDAQSMESRRAEIVERLQRVEATVCGQPYFAGPAFGMVDVVFASIFRYFDAFALMESFDYFEELPKLACWKSQLLQRQSVQDAVQPDFLPKLVAYLSTRDSALARATRRVS